METLPAFVPAGCWKLTVADAGSPVVVNCTSPVVPVRTSVTLTVEAASPGKITVEAEDNETERLPVTGGETKLLPPPAPQPRRVKRIMVAAVVNKLRILRS